MALEQLGTVLTAYELIKKAAITLKHLPKNEAIQEARQQLIDAQDIALEANGKMVALQKEKDELEARVKELEDISKEVERYELQLLGGTVSALVLKSEYRKHSGEKHMLCPDCEAANRISYLSKGRYDGGYTLSCSRCGEKGDVFEHAPRLPPSPGSGYIV